MPLLGWPGRGVPRRGRVPVGPAVGGVVVGRHSAGMSQPGEWPPQPGLHLAEWSCELLGTALLLLGVSPRPGAVAPRCTARASPPHSPATAAVITALVWQGAPYTGTSVCPGHRS